MRTSVVGEFPWAFWLVLPFALILHQVENFDRFLQGALLVVTGVLSLIDGGSTTCRRLLVL